ncbi:MAG: TPM domain-containing protein [Candidatus Methanoperedens sp.]|nr:TPM domain-containing protein [Candidatus Methanoperedens sp.]MCZ7404590.1 TPM domain-containing protein [Candidatus Methanoperedens sp.]
MSSIRSKKFKKYVLLLIIFILFLPLASAANYPQLNGFVTDNANMIDPVYKDKITQLAQKIEKESTVEIAVVTVDSLEGESKEMYAVNLFKQAGIGKKDKDNGLLILVAKQEREYRFEVGYGLEGTVTDSMKVNIGDRIIVPNFKNGEYGKGIYESMVVIEGLVTGNEEVKSQYSMANTNQNQSSQNEGLVLFAAVSILIICVILFYSIKDKDKICASSGLYSNEDEYEVKLAKIEKNNKDNKKKRFVLRLVAYAISITIVIFFPWIFMNIFMNRVIAAIIMFFATFLIQIYGLGKFNSYYEKNEIIAWGLLFSSDMTALILTLFISPELIMLTVLMSISTFGMAKKVSNGESFSGYSGSSWEKGSSGGFGGGFDGGSSGGGGGFGGGSSGGGGFGGKW